MIYLKNGFMLFDWWNYKSWLKYVQLINLAVMAKPAIKDGLVLSGVVVVEWSSRPSCSLTWEVKWTATWSFIVSSKSACLAPGWVLTVLFVSPGVPGIPARELHAWGERLSLRSPSRQHYDWHQRQHGHCVYGLHKGPLFKGKMQILSPSDSPAGQNKSRPTPSQPGCSCCGFGRYLSTT